MVKILTNRINAEKAFALQDMQHLEAIPMSDQVPASSSKLAKVTVSNQGHFYCYYATGKFSTLKNNGGPATDDGICHLRGKLVDGGTSRPIFNDYIPLDLWLTPGRVRDPLDLALSGAVSNNLFVPLTFEYMFMANTDIQLDLRNDSDYLNNFTIVFWGVRINSSMTVKGIR